MRDMVGLADMARELGVERRNLLRRLTALDREVHGMLLVRSKGKIWVNKAALDAFRAMSRDAVFDRLTHLETTAADHEARLVAVESRPVFTVT